MNTYAIIIAGFFAASSNLGAGQRITPHLYTNQYTTFFERDLAMMQLAFSNVSMVTMPLTVRMALCRMAQAADGVTNQEIMKAFSFFKNKPCNKEVPEILELLRISTMIVLNKIYLKDTKDLQPFRVNAVPLFGVHIERMHFDRPKTAMTYINSWFERASYRRLSDLLDKGDINEQTSIVFASAAHIQTTWERPFLMLDTKPGTFRNKDGKRFTVPLMSQSNRFMFYYDKPNRYKILTLPMLAFGISMMIILPDDAMFFTRVMQSMFEHPEMFFTARKALQLEEVSVVLPKFKIKSTFKYDETLKMMEIVQIFNKTDSGLKKMLKSHHEVSNMYLSLVKQKVFIDVSEDGVMKLGPQRATTDANFDRYEKEPSNADFHATSPFLFALELKVTPQGDQALLALGVYNGPEE